MKQGLQLRLSQQLAMTLQLQQAIRLLQLSTLELQQEIQTMLESNLLLEQADLHDKVEAHDTPDSESLDTREAMKQKDMPEELPLDIICNEMYSAGTQFGTGTDYRDEELLVYQGETNQTLQGYLMCQVELTPFSDTDKAISTSIVDVVDDTGYLTVPLDDILDSISDKNVIQNEVEAVLKRIQRFDPGGVAARDRRDCLLIQLTQLSVDLPYLNEARLIVIDYLNLLGSHDFRTLLHLTNAERKGAETCNGANTAAGSVSREVHQYWRVALCYS